MEVIYHGRIHRKTHLKQIQSQVNAKVLISDPNFSAIMCEIIPESSMKHPWKLAAGSPKNHSIETENHLNQTSMAWGF